MFFHYIIDIREESQECCSSDLIAPQVSKELVLGGNIKVFIILNLGLGVSSISWMGKRVWDGSRK
jgi:hypothetical protein